ncbi:MAG: CARDB domain-containing protein [Cuniculiplasma sp.]
MDSKKVLSAILIAIFLAGMANAVASSSSSSAPSSSHVSIYLYLTEGGSNIGFVTSPVVFINSTNGHFTTTEVGSTLNVSLTYGSYLITVMPATSVVGGVHYLTNKTHNEIQVGSPYQNVVLKNAAIEESYSTVNLNNLNDETATVIFSTLGGYNFYSKTTNHTSFSAYLPSIGTMFYEKSYLNGLPNEGQTIQVLTLASGNLVTITLGRSAENYFGAVYDKSTGATVNSFRVVAFNTTEHTYSTASFTGGVYYVSSETGTIFWIAANGFAPATISNSGNIKLSPSTSQITTNYNLSKNLKTISVETHYMITGTAFPDVKNNSVSSLKYQEKLDNLSLGFTHYVTKYLMDSMPMNTYYSFLANNSYYKMTSGGIHSPVYSFNSVSVYTFANYTNSNMTSADYKNLVLNIYQKGTQFTPASVNYVSNISYDNSNVSVKSASTPVTYGNPFQILPVSSNSWVTVSFGKAQKPYFVNSNAVVHYKGIKTTNSVLNSSAKNTVIVAPYDQSFSVNMSKTLFNPIIGQYQYAAPSNNFTWSSSSGNLYGYNISLSLKSTTTYNLTGKDSSGFTNVTKVTFLVLPKSQKPSVNFTYSFNGKTHRIGSAKTSNGSVSITVPQNSLITFNAASSSRPSTLNLTYNGTKYNVQLYFMWAFPNSTLSGSSVNYQFTVPSSNGVPKIAYLNATSAGNTTMSVKLMVTVNDTTAPSAVITIQNTADKNITAIPAGQSVILTGNYSSDKYYSSSKLSYNWTFLFANGSKIPSNTTNLTIIGYNHAKSSWNESSWLEVSINLVAKIHIDLKVSNPILSGYDNVTYTTTYSGPKLLVSGVQYSGTFSQGATKEVRVNVTNHGNKAVTNLSIIVYDNGKVLLNQPFTKSLAVNQTSTFYINITLPNSGSQSLSFQASNGAQPGFVQKEGQLVKTVNVGVSSDRVVLVIVAIIIIILILALLYYRLTKGKFPSVGPRRQQSLPQSNQKKITDQKQVPKKDNNTKQ